MKKKKTDILDFSDALAQIDPDHASQVMKNASTTGTPLFTVDDLRSTGMPIALLARLLVLKEGISKEKFVSIHRNRCLQSCMTANDINTNRNNIIRALKLDTMTWDFFEKLLPNLGFNLIDMQVTLSNIETGETITVSLNEIPEMVRKARPNSVILDCEEDGDE